MIAEATRTHILQTAERLGYRANTTARNLQSSRTGLIGYAWHAALSDSQPHFILDRFIYHLAYAAERFGFHLLTFTQPPDHPIMTYQELTGSRRVDGFILAETRYDDPRIAMLMQNDVPFTCFGRSTTEWDFAYVDTDGEYGMHEATRHLLDNGHERLAFLGWTPASVSGAHRLRGFERALADASLGGSGRIYQHEYTPDVLEGIIAAWATEPAAVRPTGVVAVSDLVAAQVIPIARRYGLEVGPKLALVGFDDIPTASYLQPSLTTVRQPLAKLAELAVCGLLAQFETPEQPYAQHVLTTELVVRESSTLYVW